MKKAFLNYGNQQDLFSCTHKPNDDKRSKFEIPELIPARVAGTFPSPIARLQLKSQKRDLWDHQDNHQQSTRGQLKAK